VLVIVDTAFEDSDRFLEALRMGVGLALAENRVRVQFLREAIRAVRECDPTTEAAKQLDALDELGVVRIAGGDAEGEIPGSEVVLRWGP